MNNVENVVRQKLCTSCGVCAGVCPADAITMRPDAYGLITPLIAEAACTHCGLCVKVCPGLGFDYAGACARIYGRLPEDPALGPTLSAWAGHAGDPAIREQSQSGGFVSALLIDLLERGEIDGAVVTRWSREDPLRAETFIARRRDEVLEAAGSKYNPVPAAQIIRSLRKEPGRYAFVGTSCQVQGMRKAEQVLGAEFPRIALYVGLHCLGVFTYHFHDQVLHKVGLARKDLAYFRQRDKIWRGWSGDMRLRDRQGRVYNVDANNSRLWPRPFFTDWRCLLCFDKANEFSDVSCGDCRVPPVHAQFAEQGYDIRQGLSEVVVRTPRAAEAVAQAQRDGALVLRAVEPNDVTRSIGVVEKKIGVGTFASAARALRTGVPDYGVEFHAPDGGARRNGRAARCIMKLMAAHYYVVFSLARRRLFRRALMRIPHRLFGLVGRRLLDRFLWKRVRYPACRLVLKAKEVGA